MSAVLERASRRAEWATTLGVDAERVEQALAARFAAIVAQVTGEPPARGSEAAAVLHGDLHVITRFVTDARRVVTTAEDREVWQ